jgi:hypothetical protein
MIVVTDEKNFCPKILVECVLGPNHREIIAGRNNATVQNDKVGFPGGENDCLLRAATKSDAGEQDGGVIRNFPEEAIIHGSGAVVIIGVIVFITPATPGCEALFFTPARKLHTGSEERWATL